MRLLILGGTLFLGRHIVDAALARGHTITLLTRGRRPVPWSTGVTALQGDRDPRAGTGLSMLEGLDFDVVIDTSGYVPRVVSASVSLLQPRVRRYLFVSSVSVLARCDRPGLDESAPVATLDDPGSEDVPTHYGALKAACESVVTDAFGSLATVVRPGLIVGPRDPTDRFGYWPARFVHPELLGDRAERAVVPAPRERPVQFIDARDLALWIVELIERDVGGVFNACSPAGQWTFGDLIDACVASSVHPPKPEWVSDETLLAFHVEPWTGLPLWLPANDADSPGFMLIDCERARAAGLTTRPIARTVEDTAAWLAHRDNANAWRSVLSDARERQVLSSVRAAPRAEPLA